jgi:hypothetical protein
MTDQPDRPHLPRYHSNDAQVVIYSPDEPLAWIAADPGDVVEVPMQPNLVSHTATPTPTPTPIPVEAIAGPAAVLLITVLTWVAFVIWLQNATGGRLP